MTAGRRWGIIAAGVLLVVLVPVLVAIRPVAGEDLSAPALLARIRSAADLPFSGYVETRGTVAVPVQPDQLNPSGFSGLLDGTNQLRVWWSGPETWRTASLRATGETDLFHEADRTVRWIYESKRVTVYRDPSIRLPNYQDLLPNVLAARVLDGARAGELQRLPARRIAGRSALGLRLTPADPQASIGRVDVYADAATGLPLSVDLFTRLGTGVARTPALSTSFASVSFDPPTAHALQFDPPPDATFRRDDYIDVASFAEIFVDLLSPTTLAGLPTRKVTRAVGVYGRGPTILLAIPLWHSTADELRNQLRGRPGVTEVPQGELLSSGPLTILVTPPGSGGPDYGWLLLGTVTPHAAAQAARQLARDIPRFQVPAP